MKIRHFVPLLALTAGTALYIGHISVATAHNIARTQATYTTMPTPAPTPSCLTDAECGGYNTHATDYTVEVYEDGSGVLYQGDTEVKTYDSDFFPWDCEDNGNAICGSTAPPSVRGFKCIHWDYKDLLMGYCTDGTFTWGPHDEG